MKLERVFSPIRIGAVEVPNRIVRTAHGTAMSFTDISEIVISYHEARAKGGCGLSILEAAAVHPSSAITQSLLGDKIVGGYRRLMAAIRPHGMRVFQQLWHGGNLYPAYDGPPWAVSTEPGYLGYVGRPMTEGEIQELIQSFARAAANCREGGLDGVEIHAGHGYLFQQFLSPIYNNRTDRYGGPIENRMRFLQETLRAVRAATGVDFPVGIRVSASEAPGGITEAEVNEVTIALQKEGLIDFLDASKGDYYRMATFYGAMEAPAGYELPSSTQLTEVATVPRIVTGRFRTLEEAEQVLREGKADLVSLVRAQIADPDLVRKTREGRADQVRPCIACNQGCVGGYIRNHRVGCTVNPVVGMEQAHSEDQIVKTARPKRILIVGGGPAGMEAARVAALAGHHVTLAEATAHLGGAIEIAKRAPRLQGLGDITYWLEQEIYRLGVEVQLGKYMDADDIRKYSADALVIATGSRPRMDGFQIANPGQPARGCDLPHVQSSVDLITDPARTVGRHALVLDTVGHFEGLGAAELLLERGASVTYVTHHISMSPYVESTLRVGPILERLYARGGLEILLRHHLVEIQRDHCTVRPLQAPAHQGRLVPADTVVLVTQNEPLRALFDELRSESPHAALVGDALSPRDLQLAIADGHFAARAIV